MFQELTFIFWKNLPSSVQIFRNSVDTPKRTKVALLGTRMTGCDDEEDEDEEEETPAASAYVAPSRPGRGSSKGMSFREVRSHRCSLEPP